MLRQPATTTTCCTARMPAIQNRPPLVWMLNTLMLKDSASGKDLWELRTGDIFGEPVLAGEEAYVVAKGILYSLNVRAQAVRWTFDAGGAARHPGCDRGRGFARSNKAPVTRLDRATGSAVGLPHGNHRGTVVPVLLTPRASGSRVYIGAADRHSIASTRDRASCSGGGCFRLGAVASRGRRAERLRGVHGRPPVRVLRERRSWWKTAVTATRSGRPGIGPAAASSCAPTTCYLTSVNPVNGRVRWRHSFSNRRRSAASELRPSVISRGGLPVSSIGRRRHRLRRQSNRFVYAVSADTGGEVWRFETSGQCRAADRGGRPRLFRTAGRR
jgi:hypothetical protein